MKSKPLFADITPEEALQQALYFKKINDVQGLAIVIFRLLSTLERERNSKEAS
jgi:hypothetical protein